ncbi:hypothetical protein D3C81_1707840 [compost metagenome]
MGFHQCNLCASDLRLTFLKLLARHQIAQTLVTFGFALSLGQGFFTIGDRRFRLTQGQFETVRIDAEQHLATLDHLVVAHIHLLDQPGDIRRDLHDVGTDVPVARPGREHVIHDHAPDHDNGKAHDQQGQHHATQGQKRFFHVIRYRLSESTAPSSTA